MSYSDDSKYFAANSLNVDALLCEDALLRKLGDISRIGDHISVPPIQQLKNETSIYNRLYYITIPKLDTPKVT